jgi:hypothetical protein
MPGKVIIDYDDVLPVVKVLESALEVVKEGRISVAGGIPHYCWFSIFHQVEMDRRRKKKAVVVQSRRKKKDQKSDSFRVTLEYPK